MSRAYESYVAEHIKMYKDSSKLVCAECLNDSFMNEYIESHGKSGICSFCDKQKTIIPVNDLLPRLEYYLDCMYMVNENDAPVDGGEYLWDSGESFQEIAEDLFIESNYSFVKHLISCWDLSNLYYKSDIKVVEYEGYNLFVSWNDFRDNVKRLLKNHSLICLPIEQRINEIIKSQHLILDYLGSQLPKVGGIKRLPKGQIFYRARKGEFEAKAKELGVPPKECCNNNRLSFNGQFCFYGCYSPDTCTKEIPLTSGDKYTIGKWMTTRDLCIADLSDSQYYETQIYDDYHDSVWNQEKLSNFPTNTFLSSFVNEISKPATTIEDYFPTQLVSNYLRCKTFDNEGKIDGIVYRSSKGKEYSKNVALFCCPEECGNLNDSKETHLLLLQSIDVNQIP